MITLSPGVRLVEVERSGVVESVHSGHLISLGPDGEVRESLGDPRQPVFARSCLKPLQAVGLVTSGLNLEPDELALAAASHSGSPAQLAMIGDTLTGAGLTEDDLGCPPDLPLGETERIAFLRAGGRERRLAMNCSGKHAAMLRSCLLNRWPLADYLSPEHPLQQHLGRTVTELAAEPISAIGVDGCGAPLFGISLFGLARAFGAIASATTGPRHDVAQAMRRHPELVAGPGRSTTSLMQGVAGLIAKDGAEGCFAVGFADGSAVALKIDDGAARAAEVAMVAALRRCGVSAPVLDELAVPVLGGGVPVGRLRPV